jgi:hypothetical protein
MDGVQTKLGDEHSHPEIYIDHMEQLLAGLDEVAGPHAWVRCQE